MNESASSVRPFSGCVPAVTRTAHGSTSRRCCSLSPVWSASGRPTSPTPWAHLAVRSGAEARFLKTSRALAHLAGGHADRTWGKRLAELTRPAVLVLDDFAIRELTAAQADDLYELITERAGKSLILTSNRAPADWYPLFPNPVVAESLLDRLINTSHQVFMNGPSYRPNKRPGRVVPTGTASGN